MILTVLIAASILVPLGWRWINLGFGALRLVNESIAWPTTEGRVISSEVVSRPPGGDWSFLWYLLVLAGRGVPVQHWAKVRYDYKVGGRLYESDVCSFGQHASSMSQAEERRARYPSGATVKVHYDPEHPEAAVLEITIGDARRLYWEGVWMIAIALLVAVAMFLGVGVASSSALFVALGVVALAALCATFWQARRSADAF